MSTEVRNNCPQFRKKTAAFDDPCAVHVRERQSIDTGDWQVTNFFRKCGEPVMTNCLEQQMLVYPKVYGNTPQCHVDADSETKYPPLTNLNNVQQLFQRAYAGAGFRGSGSGVDWSGRNIESSLLQGQYTNSKKSVQNSSEVNIDRFDYLPSYGNPQLVNRVIPPWTNGGILSRELVRRLSYNDYCHSLGRSPAY